MLHSPRARRLSCVLLAAILAGGCGSQGEDAEPTTAQSTTASATAEPAEPTPTPTPAATTPSPSPVSAADGKNYKACADGTCEVAVSQRVTIRLGGRAGTGSRLVIRKVLNDGLDIDLTLAGGGGGSGTLKFKDSCGPIFRFSRSGGAGNGSLCNASGSALPPPEPQAGMVALQVPGKTSGGAIVIRIVSG